MTRGMTRGHCRQANRGSCHVEGVEVRKEDAYLELTELGNQAHITFITFIQQLLQDLKYMMIGTVWSNLSPVIIINSSAASAKSESQRTPLWFQLEGKSFQLSVECIPKVLLEQFILQAPFITSASREVFW